MTGPADLALVHRLADRAGAIARHHFSAADIESQVKRDGSPVTDADREIEGTLRSLIQQEYPDDAFVGEELGTHGTYEQGRRRWVIDAIDGTASFLAGEPEWGTLIAAEEDGHITLGMVSAPALGRRWWAMQGSGSWTGPCPSGSAGPSRRLTIAEAGNARAAAIGIWPPPFRLNEPERAVAARAVAVHSVHRSGCVDTSLL